MTERLWGILVESFPKMLEYAVTVTLPLTVLSFALAIAVALIVALIQYAHVKVLSQICRFYIWVTRGTPLLVQLYIVFYGLPKVGIVMAAFPAAVIVLVRQGAIRVDGGNLTTGQVVALYNYMSQILVELLKFASLTVTINKAWASWKRIASALALTPSGRSMFR